MKFPEKIHICSSSVYYGVNKPEAGNCCWYDKGKCEKDNKKCDAVIYVKQTKKDGGK